MDVEKNKTYIQQMWDQSIVPTLMEYIKIPNKSPIFDPEWEAHGHMEKAIQLLSDWCLKNSVPNMHFEVVRLSNRTPVIFIDIPGSSDDTILLYGHLDKQPEMTGWDEDLNPWTPVLRNEKLYGRGGADDGYAIFASLTAIKSLQAQNIPHARCVILIEASEESGSPDLPFYIDALTERLRKPSLIICLDSGCGNYEQLWISTSLRGLIGGVLTIDVLKQGIHSGMGSGIVPSVFLILRQLLNRIENEQTGEIILRELFVDIPAIRLKQAADTATLLGHEIVNSYPFYQGIKPLIADPKEQLLNRTWRPALSIIGGDGLPPGRNAGNVTLPSISIKLSMRLPPTLDAESALQFLKTILEASPPYQAQIHFEPTEAGSGWNAPVESPWLTEAANQASLNYFGANAMYIGEGGSIPFMGMLGKKFPQAQFLITGLLGPESNAHGPNEFLHIPAGKKLTACVAEVIMKHSENFYSTK
jgi:acetylornithine deacetylase/succinyl-diaminopimelate desuccinylase-like protein